MLFSGLMVSKLNFQCDSLGLCFPEGGGCEFACVRKQKEEVLRQNGGMGESDVRGGGVCVVGWLGGWVGAGGGEVCENPVRFSLNDGPRETVEYIWVNI